MVLEMQAGQLARENDIIPDMLVDDIVITIKAGNGGDGAISFRRNEGNPRGGPDGGNGGNGGDIYLVGVNDLTALQQFRYKKVWKAPDGVAGKKKNLFGKNADDLTIALPVGTQVKNEAGEILFEINDTITRHLIARGGKGGRGNNEFKSATNQAPYIAERGGKGEEKKLHLQLRLIADIGLIGLPNAGKSTLLSLLTSAKPKIGDYPFTTLEPNVGMMDEIMIADIPGLIEGASSGKGLGITFLKHIEKTKLLLHCIDCIQPNPFQSYTIIRNEFKKFNPELLTKPEIIILTKTDEARDEDLKAQIKNLSKTKRKIILLSALDDTSVNRAKEEIISFFQLLNLP
ncbi:MAG TPA: GTPase ObgE [Patescibacteria group bacterium]|nr:GTPase ObgE [Patescibacteria group bacterium]